jgi:thioesterase domain-containing protein
MKKNEFQVFIEKKIPLLKKMGAKIEVIGADKTVLSAPYAPNINHLGTVFGGSIVSLQAVASWVWFLSLLDKHNLTGELVAKSVSTKFILPVRSDFKVVTHGVSKTQVGRIVKALKEKKKTRATIMAKVICKNKVCAEFSGQFVIY